MIESADHTLLGLARSLLTATDLDDVLHRVIEEARRLTGARYAALGVLDEERTGLARFLTAGVDEQTRREIGALPTGRGVLGELIEHARPLRLDDVGAHPRSYGFPPGHPPMRTFLGVPVLIGDVAYGNLYLTEKPGGPFTESDEQAVVLLAALAGLAIDNARRFAASEERRRELERTVATLDATMQIARALGGQTELPAILELVAKRGRALVSARTLLIELLDGDELVIAAGAGELPADLIGRRVPLANTVASAALRTRSPQRLADELNRARFDQAGAGRLGVVGRDGLVVPLVFHNEAHGVLVALDRLDDGPAFGADDERLLLAFASSAATAVATARLVSAERQVQRAAAAEDERRRWARELHDETLQGLAALRLRLSAARRMTRPEALDDALAEAMGQIEAEIASLRALITELRPAALDELGTAAALEALAARVGDRGGLRVSLEVALRPERHAPELETAIYRIAQEGLTNAERHSGARSVRLTVDEDARAVTVMLADDGHGFDPSVRAEGFGLLGMRERAELLGGRLEVDSAVGRGTVVRATLPTRRAGRALA